MSILRHGRTTCVQNTCCTIDSAWSCKTKVFGFLIIIGSSKTAIHWLSWASSAITEFLKGTSMAALCLYFQDLQRACCSGGQQKQEAGVGFYYRHLSEQRRSTAFQVFNSCTQVFSTYIRTRLELNRYIAMVTRVNYEGDFLFFLLKRKV